MNVGVWKKKVAPDYAAKYEVPRLSVVRTYLPLGFGRQ